MYEQELVIKNCIAARTEICGIVGYIVREESISLVRWYCGALYERTGTYRGHGSGGSRHRVVIAGGWCRGCQSLLTVDAHEVFERPTKEVCVAACHNGHGYLALVLEILPRLNRTYVDLRQWDMTCDLGEGPGDNTSIPRFPTLRREEETVRESSYHRQANLGRPEICLSIISRRGGEGGMGSSGVLFGFEQDCSRVVWWRIEPTVGRERKST
ncbi:hypothetical protein C8F01DRAFT_1233924 [Mycena amicta]|nr:hypothetical protein C8F01DRAFT_1233924 [Mycena amicta]